MRKLTAEGAYALKIIDAHDPDWWLSQGRNLLDFRLPSREQMADPRIVAAFAAQPELAAHLGRWLSRTGEMISLNERVGDTLTEVELRATWEETRLPPAPVRAGKRKPLSRRR